MVIAIQFEPKRTSSQLSAWKTFKQLDPVGFILFAPFYVMLLLALEWGGTTYAWDSSRVLGLLIGSLHTLCVFIAWERYIGAETSMLPLPLLRQRIIYSSCLTGLFQLGAVQVPTFYLPIWFQSIKSAPPVMSGMYYLATTVTSIIFAPLSGALGMYMFNSPSHHLLTLYSDLLWVLPASHATGQQSCCNWSRSAGHAFDWQQNCFSNRIPDT